MKWLYKAEEVICGVLIIAAVLVLNSNIFLRFFFDSSFAWSEEFIRLMFIWITFIGVAVCARRNTNISIDILQNFLKGKSKRILDIIITIISLVFVIMLGKFGMDMVFFTMDRPQKLNALQWPIYIVYWSIPVGCALMTIHYIRRIFKLVSKG